ncbi:unnamed protein product, partial [Prorocentrum cordatum]
EWTLEMDPDGPRCLCEVQPADVNDQPPGHIAQNLMTAAAYGDHADREHTMSITFSATGESIKIRDIASRHRMGKFQISPASPGDTGIVFEGAAFESERFSGRLYFNFLQIAVALGLQNSHANASAWFHKRRQRWEQTSQRFGGSGLCLRPSVPYGRLPDDDTDAERCLMFPSISLRFTVLLTLRSFAATHTRHGLLKSDSKDACEKVFIGLIAKLPVDMQIPIRLDHRSFK